MSFDFGSNWKAFSAAKLDAVRVQEARASLRALLGEQGLRGRSFLDVGCGSGLFAMAAAAEGAAPVLGFDVNQTAVETCERNADLFATEGAARPRFRVGSILDPKLVASLGRFDIVYAWGSLHHTGAMWRAIEATAGLVEPGGTLVLAIYNAHWTAPAWKQVKRVYNLTPRPLRGIWHLLFGGLIYLAVLAATRRSPLRKERGMDFWYDVVDWLGGYPYEVASVPQLQNALAPLGFTALAITRPRVGTGCNELVLRHAATAPEPGLAGATGAAMHPEGSA